MRTPRRRLLLLAGLLTVALALPASAKRRAVGGVGNPRAFNDGYSVTRGAVLEVNAAAGVLANDVERDGVRLIAILLVRPREGTLTLRADGSFIYTHSGTGAPSDTFIYKANNGTTDSAPATVTLSIGSAQAPRAQSDSYVVANHGALEVAAPGVLANDSGGGLSALLAAPAAHGNVSLAADGSFVYTHDGSSSTSDVFTYRASDGSLFSAATPVTLTILAAQAPGVADQSYSTAQDTPLIIAAPGLLSGASDPDSPVLTAVKTGAPAHGTVNVASNGSFTYLPAPGYIGPDSFTFAATDGANTSANGTASINVLAGAYANADFYNAKQDEPILVTAPGVLANDATGLTITSFGGTTGKEQTVIGAGVRTLRGGIVALNADGSFSYTPASFFAGTDSFGYYGSNATGVTSALVTITVHGRPAAHGDSYTAVHDQILQVSAPGVLGNDTLYGATVTANSPAQHGSVTLLANGSFQYVPIAGYGGPDVFTYTIANFAGTSTALVGIYVYLAPLAGADLFANQGTFDQTVPTVLANDTPNGATIVSYGAASGTENTTLDATVATALGGTVSLSATGTFHYTPPAAGTASDTFKYVLKNPAGTATGTVTIFRAPPPVARNDSYVSSVAFSRTAATGVLANDDLNSGTLTTTGTFSTAQGGSVTLQSDGSFAYTPPGGSVTSDSFQYTLTNPAGSSTGTVSIFLLAAPVANNDEYTTTGTLTVNAANGVLQNDVRNAADIYSYGAFTGAENTTIGATVPTLRGGTITLQADGSFLYGPPPVDGANDSFKYVLKNAAGTSTASVTITFTP